MADRPNDPATTNPATATTATFPGSGAENLNTGNPPKAMDAQGSVGKAFTTEGAIGGTAQKIGGPLDKQGFIGKQFTTEGAIGGKVQDALGGKK